ncbi:ATP-binding protein [Enterococcus olivae]
MTLTKKTAIYTALTTLFMGLLIISYFMWMLPGLYASYKTDQYIETLEDVHRRFMEGKTFGEDYQLTDNFVITSVKFPAEGEKIQVSTPYVSLDLLLKDPELSNMYHQIRAGFEAVETEKEMEELFASLDFEPLKERVVAAYQPISQGLVELQNIETYPFEMIQDSETAEFYLTSDDIIIAGGTIEQNVNSYASYYALKEDKGDLYLTFSSAMTPKLTELMPIVAQSIPMIVSVLIVLSCLIAYWFSRKLARPVEMLASQAQTREETKGQVFHQPNTGDEFEVLENALNNMHMDLQNNLQQLHQKNHELEAMNQKQRLLLTNASHQLKTPIAAAALLVESMSQKVGKFKDTPKYLPAVYKELQKMQEIVQQLMFLFEEQEREVIKSIAVDNLIKRSWANHEEKSQQRGLKTDFQLIPVTIETEENLFFSIVDNLLQNAVKYTPVKHSVVIILTGTSLTIISEQARISEELLEHIREPFVRDSAEEEAGTGLGLYLVDRFSELLGMVTVIENTERGVEARIEWSEET